MPTFSQLPSGKWRAQVRRSGIYRAATFSTKREARDWATSIEAQAVGADRKLSRTNVVGIFPNDASIVRLVGAMMLEQNDEWSLNRRYMQLEGLQALSDTAPTRLSAVAR